MEVDTRGARCRSRWPGLAAPSKATDPAPIGLRPPPPSHRPHHLPVQRRRLEGQNLEVQLDAERFLFARNFFAETLDYIYGQRSLNGTGNGQTETHVIRMWSACVGSSASCRLQAKTGQIHRNHVIHTLYGRILAPRRVRGAIDRIWGPPGAAWAAPDAPRRPWTAPTAIPGVGKVCMFAWIGFVNVESHLVDKVDRSGFLK